VETSRAVLAFASLNNAILDPHESDSAFAQILATQRSGSITATFSEVRFRSDCIVIVGDDRLLASMPMLPHVLMRPDSNAATELRVRRVVLMGNWTSEAVSSFRRLGFETQAIQMDPHDFPNAMHTWSRLTSDEREQSASLPSRWMESADYLAIVWAPSNLCLAGADLWIERLQLWISGQNTSRRVVGLPLAGNYQSFQQVATWTTGFPGRMRLECDSHGEMAVDFQPVRYRKEAVADLSLAPTIIEVNDTVAFPNATKVFSPDILISPTWFPGPAGVDPGKQKVAPKIFIPCSIPGIESLAQYFRADSVYSVKVEPQRSTSLPMVSELLNVISPGAQRP
jgi:formylmethanofuran dehydrogenase subunit B